MLQDLQSKGKAKKFLMRKNLSYCLKMTQVINIINGDIHFKFNGSDLLSACSTKIQQLKVIVRINSP